MLSGVTIVDPGQTSIDLAVTVGSDTAIKPGVVLEGDVTIGSNCTIGPNIHLVGPQAIADDTIVA